MISEAIEKVQQLSVAAQSPSFIKLPGDPAHIVYQVEAGKATRVEATPPVRSVKLLSLDDLIALGKSHFDKGVKDSDRLLCFYSADQVQLVWDHITGRERATVALTLTDEFKFFQERITSPTVEVADLRHALRVKLRKTYTDASLVEQVSSLAFTDTNKAAIAAGRGKESMRSDVLEEVDEPSKLPDPFQTFHVRSYTNPDLDVRFPVQCVLDPDPKSRRWYIQPLEDSWIDMRAMQAKHIGDKLRGSFAKTNVAVFEGTYQQDAK